MTIHRTTLRATALSLPLLALACSSGDIAGVAPSLAPAFSLQAATSSHPAGTVRVDSPAPGRPFAVAASAAGVVLVGEQDLSQLGRANLPATAVAQSISVGADPTDVAFNVEGTMAVVTNQVSQTLGVVNIASNTQTQTIPVTGNPFRAIVSREPGKAYVTTSIGTLLKIDVKAHTTQTLQLSGPLNGIALHPTAPTVYVTSTSGRLYAVSTATWQVTNSVAVAGTAQEVVVSRDGTLLFVAVEGGALEVHSASTLALVTTLPAVFDAFGAAISPDNAQLWVTLPRQAKVVVVDVATLQVINSFPAGFPRRVTFDRAGTTGIFGDENNTVTFIR